MSSCGFEQCGSPVTDTDRETRPDTVTVPRETLEYLVDAAAAWVADDIAMYGEWERRLAFRDGVSAAIETARQAMKGEA